MKKVFKLTSEGKVNFSRLCVSRQASLALFYVSLFLHVPCCSRIAETEKRNRFPVSTLHINSKSIMKKLRFEFEKSERKYSRFSSSHAEQQLRVVAMLKASFEFK